MEILDFEDLPANCSPAEVWSNRGSGPIPIEGVNPRAPRRRDRALVIDTERPPAVDPDLKTPGKSPDNQTAMRNALIVSKEPPDEEGFVAVPDDERIAGGKLRFNFEPMSETPGTGVIFYGISLIDHDDGRTRIRLFRRADSQPFAELEASPDSESLYGLEATGGVRLVRDPFIEIQVPGRGEDNVVRELRVEDLRPTGERARRIAGDEPLFEDGIPGVLRMEVILGGSSAVDSIRFRREGSLTLGDPTAESERALWAEVKRNRKKIEARWTEFETDWNELVEQETRKKKRLYKRELQLLESARNDLVRELECGWRRCGCPELRPLRAWVASYFDQAIEGVEAARTRGSSRAGSTPELSPGATPTRRHGAPIAVLAQRRPDIPDDLESNVGILRFIKDDLWQPLVRLFGYGRPTLRITAGPCSDFHFAFQRRPPDRGDPIKRLRQCEGATRELGPTRIFFGLYNLACIAEDGSVNRLGARFFPADRDESAREAADEHVDCSTRAATPALVSALW